MLEIVWIVFKLNNDLCKKFDDFIFKLVLRLDPVTTEIHVYCMSKKSCTFLYSKYTMNIEQDSLQIILCQF